MIRSTGIGSGLDVNAIVSQLMAVEQQPLIQLQRKKSVFDTQISEFGKVKNSLSKIQSTINLLNKIDNFAKISATSSDSAIVTAAVSTGAAAESHAIEVTALAKAHRLSSALFASASTEIGTGELTIANGSDSFLLNINSNNNTLAGIRDAINSATDNTSVTASIINVDGGSRLILNAKNTGLTNQLDLTVALDGDGDDTDNIAGLSRLVYHQAGIKNLSQLDAAIDSVVKVNSYTVTSSSNEVSNVISGVTLSLKTLGTATITLKSDFSSIESTMKTLVSDVNALRKTMSDVRINSLSGENFILGIENKIRNLFSSGYPGGIGTLADLGFSFSKDGVLSLDSGKLTTALANNPDAVKELFTTADTGFAMKMDSLLDSYLSVSGLIQGKTDGLSSSIKVINQRIIDLDYRLVKREERMYSQFTALDSLLSNLQTTSGFLTQQLANISAITNNRR